MIIIGSILLILYLISLGILIYGYQQIPENKLNPEENNNPNTHFSIIIPFRNEAKNLPGLLKTITQLNYPENLFEIIFVDDESEDNSVEIISKELINGPISFKIINNNRKSASPKKDAITEAITQSKYGWILTTDADCMLPENWLSAFDTFIQKYNPTMLVGPVRYIEKNGLINNYQQMDNYSLQTTTVGSFGLKNPLLCNGANLAYKKEEFRSVLGFSENNHIASGDDVFLLEKFKKRNPKAVQFIKNKEAMVLTQSQESWKNIINQRVRWASKTSKQKDIFTKLLSIIVSLSNLFVLIGLLFCLLQFSYFNYYFQFLAFKIVFDYLFLYQTSSFFRKKINPYYFIINILIYPIITVIIVLKAIKGNYIWKGRTYS